jgi:hypothetical protein
MKTAGVSNPVLYEAIAAPGSGQGTYIDATTPYFAGDQGYDNNMLGVLIDKSEQGKSTKKNTLPVLVLGTGARAWGQLTTGCWPAGAGGRRVRQNCPARITNGSRQSSRRDHLPVLAGRPQYQVWWFVQPGPG